MVSCPIVTFQTCLVRVNATASEDVAGLVVTDFSLARGVWFYPGPITEGKVFSIQCLLLLHETDS